MIYKPLVVHVQIYFTIKFVMITESTWRSTCTLLSATTSWTTMTCLRRLVEPSDYKLDYYDVSQEVSRAM